VSISSQSGPVPERPVPYIILDREDYRVLGPVDFGGPGLEAIEVLGPYVDIQASGPLITVHDSTVDAHQGIGHHRHRYNERLFYITAGELDHDDSLNDIQGHMATGDVGLFTEGQRGMVHSEWNNGDAPAHAYILVYTTDPVPEETKFTRLRDEEAPRYDEDEGVHTKELVGPRSALRVHGDLRFFADSHLEVDGRLSTTFDDGEGGLFAVREGRVRLDGAEIGPGATVLVPPAQGKRAVTLEATSAARVFRAAYGPGHGFVRRSERGR
jgi:redox-sensitive bicupin YhaK (pirin superfamily)